MSKMMFSKVVALLMIIGSFNPVIAGSSATPQGSETPMPRLEEVANGDAQFWLYQGPPNNRLMTCNIYYTFNTAVDADILLARLKDLVASYKMFQRNVVEVDGLPFWQDAKPDWQQHFRILREGEDIEAWRKQSEIEVSAPSQVGEGIPHFRAALSPDRRQFIFTWHHVISDYEGMFNKHAKHIFQKKDERTQYGYQISGNAAEDRGKKGIIETITSSLGTVVRNVLNTDRPLGFVGTGFNVQTFVLPVGDRELSILGRKADLPMSDIFSFIALRTITRYHEMKGETDDFIAPIVTPLSLRKSSLETDEGNNRAIKTFPLAFPLETVREMHGRVIGLSPASSSYDSAGKLLKKVRAWPSIEPLIRRLAMPDYISNYFPLADMRLNIADATLISHHLRVCMVGYERTKFAWSNYNGKVQLFLHTDPLVVEEELMSQSFRETSSEILDYLSQAATGKHSSRMLK